MELENLYRYSIGDYVIITNEDGDIYAEPILKEDFYKGVSEYKYQTKNFSFFIDKDGNIKSYVAKHGGSNCDKGNNFYHIKYIYDKMFNILYPKKYQELVFKADYLELADKLKGVNKKYDKLLDDFKLLKEMYLKTTLENTILKEQLIKLNESKGE